MLFRVARSTFMAFHARRFFEQARTRSASSPRPRSRLLARIDGEDDGDVLRARRRADAGQRQAGRRAGAGVHHVDLRSSRALGQGQAM